VVFLRKRLASSAYSRGSSSRAFRLVPRRSGDEREWEVHAAAGGAVAAVGAVFVWDDDTGENTSASRRAACTTFFRLLTTNSSKYLAQLPYSGV
jgi:hypothetical protein